MFGFRRLPSRFLRALVILVATAGLAGCIGYNTPLAPPAKEPWSASCEGIHGQWIGSLDDKPDAPMFMMVAEAGPEHEAVLFLSDPKKLGDWMVAFAHPTTIGGRTYMNMRGMDLRQTRDIVKYDSEWIILACATRDRGAGLELRMLDSKKSEFFEQAGIGNINPDRLGETLAEYLRRFGPEALLSKERFTFRRAHLVPVQGG